MAGPSASNGGSPTSSPGVTSAVGALPRGVTILLGTAALVVTVAGIRAVAWLAGPLLLALVIVIAVSPIQAWLRRKGWPGWASTLSLLVVIYGTLLVLAVFLVVSVGRLATLLSENTARTRQLTASLSAGLAKLGLDPEHARNTVRSADLGRLVSSLGSALSELTGVLTGLVLILALLLFLAADSGGAAARRMAVIHSERPHMISALDGFVHGTRNYLVVTAVFGLIVAVLDTVALAAMGIPLALLWGVLSFVTNFIPNIGFVIGLLPPALLALIIGGWGLALAVVIVYCVINAVLQSLVQPRFVGNSVGLSATVAFLALLFWAWVLGPLGALLAIPMTLLVKAIMVDADPRARWVEALLGSEPSPAGGKPHP